MLDEIRSLPDSMEVDELSDCFVKFLEYVDAIENSNYEEETDALFELALRQHYTFEILEPKLKSNVEKLVEKILLSETRSLKAMDCILSITATLGLEKIYKMLVEALELNIDLYIKQEIRSLIKECGENINDPYHKYKRI